MKWYKHITTSLDDPFIFDLIDRFGGDGYLVFFGTLEIMAREFDVNNPGICTISEGFLKKKLQLSRQKMVKILNFCEKNSRIFTTFHDGNITLKCPKLKDMADEWTKTQLRSNSGGTPSQEVEVEVDKEEESNNPPSPQGERKTGKKILLDRFEIFWKHYPKKKNKGQAEKTWLKIKPTEKLLEIIITAIDKARTSEDWIKDNGQFIPHPSTWLNAKGWEDEHTKLGKKDNWEGFDDAVK